MAAEHPILNAIGTLREDMNPIANVADLTTTQIAINSPGLKEANPFMRSPWVRYGVKPAYSLGTAAYATKLAKDGHKGAATIVSLIPTLIAGMAAIHNVGEMRK